MLWLFTEVLLTFVFISWFNIRCSRCEQNIDISPPRASAFIACERFSPGKTLFIPRITCWKLRCLSVYMRKPRWITDCLIYTDAKKTAYKKTRLLHAPRSLCPFSDVWLPGLYHTWTKPINSPFNEPRGHRVLLYLDTLIPFLNINRTVKINK